MVKPIRARRLLELRSDEKEVIEPFEETEDVSRVNIIKEAPKKREQHLVPKFKKKQDVHLNKSNIRLIL